MGFGADREAESIEGEGFVETGAKGAEEVGDEAEVFIGVVGERWRVVRVFGEVLKELGVGQEVRADVGGQEALLEEPGLDAVLDLAAAADILGGDAGIALFTEAFAQPLVGFDHLSPALLDTAADGGFGLGAELCEEGLKLRRRAQTHGCARLTVQGCEEGEEAALAEVRIIDAVVEYGDNLAARADSGQEQTGLSL